MSGKRKIGIDPPGVDGQRNISILRGALCPAGLNAGFIADGLCPKRGGIKGKPGSFLGSAIGKGGHGKANITLLLDTVL